MTNDAGKLSTTNAPPTPVGIYVVVAAIVVVLLLFAFGVFGGIPATTRGQLLRVGAVALAAGVLLATYFWFRARQPWRLPGIAEDSVSYNIARLADRREILASSWIWMLLPMVPGIVLIYAGAANTRAIGITWAIIGLVIIALVFTGVILASRKAAAAVQAEIDELQKSR